VYWTTTFRNRNTCKFDRKRACSSCNHIYSNQVIHRMTNDIICEYSRLIHWVQVLGMDLFRDINVGVYFRLRHRVNYSNQHRLIHRKIKMKASHGLKLSIHEHNFSHGLKNMLVLKQYNILEKSFLYLVSEDIYKYHYKNFIIRVTYL
jgi:hypothetical protein